ncbi:MAG: hypothetical protein GWO41_06635 [candidate division Zixibacteria bacterium]|nr:hypothetical protein [candidate division Zixibacteria bacterium]NIR62893.1 hypothetical protein [candidate division Zixibacteria bacterium]NIS16001.1 hypothetical protein [candidate division Zixibacteria bacterium]NIS44908.1 hypothetical protein [candidate division Zixibacteria bacterium]NIT52410.1 hypothetical protein [candidate division Zixibacteria bacterium]
MDKHEICPICGKRMGKFNHVHICVECNDRYGDYYNFFANAVGEYKGDEGREMVMIECPGATIYDKTNTKVVQGVKWKDPHDFSKGYAIIKKRVYAPDHQPKRVIPRDKINNICRCQACQDLTIKMRTYNNQKSRGTYTQDSPMMPRHNPGEDFSPLPDSIRSSLK